MQYEVGEKFLDLLRWVCTLFRFCLVFIFLFIFSCDFDGLRAVGEISVISAEYTISCEQSRQFPEGIEFEVPNRDSY